jgi:hypothetical protein
MCFDKIEDATPGLKLLGKVDPLHHIRKAAKFNSFTSNKAARDAARAAEAAEAERQARISGNVADINKAFAGREGQYKAFADAVRRKYTGDLNRQYADANRNLKFELAGAGLTGGSVAVDQGRELSRQMTEGTIAAESKANEAEANLRGQDEQSRLSMIGLAQSGGDIGNAASQTANMLRANIDRGNSTIGALGDVFGSTANVYKQMQEARNIRRGLKQSEIYATPFTRGSGAGGV